MIKKLLQEQKYQEVIETYQDDPQYLAEVTEAYLRMGNPEKALAKIQDAYHKDQGMILINYVLANIMLKKKIDYERLLSKVDIESLSMSQLETLVIVYSHCGLLDQMKKTCELLLDKNPEFGYYGLYNAYFLEKDYDKAYEFATEGYLKFPNHKYALAQVMSLYFLENYQQVIEISKRHESNLMLWYQGNAYLKMEDYENALMIFNQLDPKDFKQLELLKVSCYIALNQYDKAISLLKTLPENDEVTYKLAICYYYQKNYQECFEFGKKIYQKIQLKQLGFVIKESCLELKNYEEAYQLFKDNHLEYHLLFAFYLDQYKEVVTLSEKLETLTSEQEYMLATSYFVLENYEKAIEYYEKLTSFKNANVLLNLAYANYQLQQLDKAEQYINEALTLDSKNVDILEFAVQVYSAAKKHQKAEELLEQLKGKIEETSYHEKAVVLCMQLQNFNRALSHFEHLDCLNPEKLWIAYQKGICEMATLDYSLAIKQFDFVYNNSDDEVLKDEMLYRIGYCYAVEKNPNYETLREVLEERKDNSTTNRQFYDLIMQELQK